jgi:chromosome segregation ATPase
VSKQE